MKLKTNWLLIKTMLSPSITKIKLSHINKSKNQFTLIQTIIMLIKRLLKLIRTARTARIARLLKLIRRLKRVLTMKKMSDKYIDINQPIKYNRFTNNFRWINMSLFDGF